MAMFAALVCLLLCGSLVLGGDPGYLQDERFLRWTEAYLEDGSVDLAEVYPIWRRNAEFVDRQNALGLSYTVSLNAFAHMTPDKIVGQTKTYQIQNNVKFESDKNPPKSVDWRTKGVVRPVQNQGQCGDPIAFSVVGAIDSLHAIETGKLVEGSEEEFVDCCEESQGGCVGELLGNPYQCVVRIGGLAGEEYNSPDGSCRNNSFPAIIKIKGGKDVVPYGSEYALEVAVAKQPVAAFIDASHNSFQFYTGGVYDEPDCSSTQLDHSVLVVGYGSLNGTDYWICQNSWGKDWGMKGYILMSRNKNNQCGIATMASYPY